MLVSSPAYPLLQGAAMTLQMARENLCALQNEVLVASVLGSELLKAPLEPITVDRGGPGGAAGGPRWSEGGSGLQGGAASSSGGGAAPTTASSPFWASGKLLLWHLHQHGQAAPWAEAVEVGSGGRGGSQEQEHSIPPYPHTPIPPYPHTPIPLILCPSFGKQSLLPQSKHFMRSLSRIPH